MVISRFPDAPGQRVTAPAEAERGMDELALRVVIADDVVDSATMLGELLRQSGCEVWVTNDGQQALRQVEEQLPHCVIYDVVMPLLHGNQLSRRIRARHGSEIVLIAMSGFGSDDPRVAEAFETADHYFVKPVDLKGLLRVLTLAM